MNVLILGAGFIGKNLAKGLSKIASVTIVNNLPVSDVDFADVYIHSLNDSASIISIIKNKKIDTVVHLISSIVPGSDAESYLSDIENVYKPSIRLLEFCSDNKIRFVYFSSGGAVYGNKENIFSETTLREPISYYGLSKLCFEETITFYHRTKLLQYLIIRPSNPYGHGQNLSGKQGVIAVIMGKILKNESIEIWGDGSAIKDYIYIDDLVEYVIALLSEGDWNQVYNIGSGVGSSINEVIKAFEDTGAKLPEIKYCKEKVTDVHKSVLDCREVKNKVNINCLSLRDGIKKFYLETMEMYGQSEK